MGRAVGIGVVLVLCGGCDDSISGSIDVRNATGEAYTFRPGACVDGDEYHFWGVQLQDGPRAVDIFERDDVPYAGIYSPGQAAFEIALDSCAVFKGELTRQTINGSAEMRGDFTFDCTDAEGHAMVGDVSFSQCGADDND